MLVLMVAMGVASERQRLILYQAITMCY